MPVEAVQHIRRMRGGAQSHLMRCSDENYYVVKFSNNPQHVRVLANEYLATGLAELVGLPVPSGQIVEVSPWLVKHTEELTFVLSNNSIRVEAGLQFGSRYAVSPASGQVFDYLPPQQLGRVRNLEAFAGILAFDKWTGNADGRQVAFWRNSRERKLTAAFIDHGYCFNAEKWTFPDDPLRGVFARNEVYLGVTGWNAFEPSLSRIEAIREDAIWAIATKIPPHWYSNSCSELKTLVETLIQRKAVVRELILEFQGSSRRPFPGWSIH